MEQGARGVQAFNPITKEPFVLRFYLVFVFGDMQAIAAIMRFMGPSGLAFCLCCFMRGVWAPSHRHHYACHAHPLEDDE